MSRRLEKLIEQKAWETLTDYGYNDAHLLEQLAESVMERLDEQQTVPGEPDFPGPRPRPAGPTRGGGRNPGFRPRAGSSAPAVATGGALGIDLPQEAITSSLNQKAPPGADPGSGGAWFWDDRGYYYKGFRNGQVMYYYGGTWHSSPPKRAI